MCKIRKVLGFFVLTGFIIVLSGCADSDKNAETAALSKILEENKDVSVPSRPADINGTIVSIEGDVMIVKSEINKEILSEEDQVANKELRQEMTQEERQALRAEEKEAIETQDIEVILPVGTPLYKGSGSSDGETIKAEFLELQKGIYVSIWQQDDQIEVVKIKGTN